MKYRDRRKIDIRKMNRHKKEKKNICRKKCKHLFVSRLSLGPPHPNPTYCCLPAGA